MGNVERISFERWRDIPTLKVPAYIRDFTGAVYRNFTDTHYDVTTQNRRQRAALQTSGNIVIILCLRADRTPLLGVVYLRSGGSCKQGNQV